MVKINRPPTHQNLAPRHGGKWIIKVQELDSDKGCGKTENLGESGILNFLKNPFSPLVTFSSGEYSTERRDSDQKSIEDF